VRFAEIYSQPIAYNAAAYYSSGSYSIGLYNTANAYCPNLAAIKDIYLDLNQDYAQTFPVTGVSSLGGGALVADIMRYYSTAVIGEFQVSDVTESQYTLTLNRTSINALLLDKYVYEVKAVAGTFQQVVQTGRILIKT
jgi:hypothetical protein